MQRGTWQLTRQMFDHVPEFMREEKTATIITSIQWLGTKRIRDELLEDVDEKLKFTILVNKWDDFMQAYIKNVTDMVLYTRSLKMSKKYRYVLTVGILKTQVVFNKLKSLVKLQLEWMLQEPIFREAYRHHVENLDGIEKILVWIEKGEKIKSTKRMSRHLEHSGIFDHALLDMAKYTKFILSFLDGHEYSKEIGKQNI